MRVLDAEKYAKTQQLSETARDFCGKVAQLSDTVGTVVDAVDRQVRLRPSRASSLKVVVFAWSDRTCASRFESPCKFLFAQRGDVESKTCFRVSRVVSATAHRARRSRLRPRTSEAHPAFAFVSLPSGGDDGTRKAARRGEA